MYRIILTGGGTAGHVTPNLALVDALREAGFEISYIGSKEGMEKELVQAAGLPYYGISTGKLRRYFDLKNFTDPFRTIKGFGEASSLIKKLRPHVIFSKGGYVTVPVVHAAAARHVPIVCHESDMSPGLANRISLPFATRVCCNFEETRDMIKKGRAIVTGLPIRRELFEGDRNKALEFTGFSGDRPVLLVTGGSLGSANINEAVRRILTTLTATFDVVHLCGRGKLDPTLHSTGGYVQYEYVGPQMKELFALADIVVSRAGANAVCELLALRKPSLLIPLGSNASRGDQIQNAASFEKRGYSMVLREEDMNDDTLTGSIMELFEKRSSYIAAMESSPHKDAVSTIVKIITSCVNFDIYRRTKKHEHGLH